MNRNVALNSIRDSLLHVFTEYAIRKINNPERNQLCFNPRNERELFKSFLAKNLYGKLNVLIDWPNSKDIISVNNPDHDKFNGHMICFVHFDFRKERPTLNYVYKDSTLTMSLPELNELE